MNDIEILIIEDDPAISLGLQELLKYENYNVLICSDGKEGFDTALAENPDLIILDINLPSLNGFEVCRRLRDNDFLNPVIMLTSRDDPMDKIIGLEFGACDYLTKPFNSRELLARIHAQLLNTERLIHLSEQVQTRKSERKLLAVMFTDMKDFSRIMNINEQLALKLLEIHNNIVKEAIYIHEGKVVEIIGDAFVATFNSAVKAVECAFKVQGKLKLYNENKPPDELIEVRIGVHLGDVMLKKDKIRGDAVNIAARIQQNSDAGEVTISENVYTTIRNKLNYQFEYAGEFNLKNIAEPVKLYRLKS